MHSDDRVKVCSKSRLCFNDVTGVLDIINHLKDLTESSACKKIGIGWIFNMC